jgi:hypothetical protein
MSLRDDTEAVLRSWNAHEIGPGASPVVDYDCHPSSEPVKPAASRLEIYRALTALRVNQPRC